LGTKDILLKITGNQFSGKEEDRIEFMTAGTLETKGNVTYISYDETAISGMEGFKTSLTIEPGKVTMSRCGAQMQETVMEFVKGRRYHGLYSTPYGNIGMELLTNDVSGIIADGEFEKLSIDYDLSLKGISESRNTINIEIIGEEQ